MGKWITLNEPWCSAWLGYGSGHHAPGIHDIGQAAAATHHLLLGHGQAMRAIRSAAGAAEVGISLNLTPTQPAATHADDIATARRLDGNCNRLFLDPLVKGCYPADMLSHYQGCNPGFTVVRDGDLEVISQPLDFLCINFYTLQTVAARSRTAEAFAAGYCIPAVAPDGSVRDPERIRYIDGHLRAVLQARIAGVDVRGYFVWSLMDNFEWAYGYSKRFGLVWVDYPTRTRIPKDSFWWYAQTVRANALVPAAEATATFRA